MVKSKRVLTPIERMIRKLPQAVEPVYAIAPPNRPTRVFKGRLHARPGKVVLSRARLEYRWLPNTGLRFAGEIRSGFDPEQDLSAIRAPKNGAWIDAYVTTTGLGRAVHVDGGVQDCLRLGPNRPVQAVLFHMPNFHEYVGDRVRSDSGLHRGRLMLRAGDWIVTLDQSIKHRDILKAVQVRGGFGGAHAGLITRADRSRFRIEQISDFWSMLLFYFTFARGNWCGPIIPMGMGSRGPIWEEWCNWRIRPWRGVRSWFPLLAEQTEQVFKGFHALWNDQSWNEPLRELVNWYVEANLNSGAAEGALVLAHAGLDLLSWMRLVVQKQVYTAKDFEDNFHADERFRAVFGHLGIPGDVPASLVNVYALAQSENLKDGAELINRLRNAVVHPTPTKRRFLAKVSVPCRVEALHLALHFLELGILAVCNYQGEYVTRLKSGVSRSEATLKVPWAKP